MDIKNRMLLQHHQQEIIKDLDSDRVERARYLLETLVQNGNNSAYEAFVDSLAKDYNWLWVKLALGNNKAMIEDSFEDSISRGDVPRLPDHFVRREAVENNVANKLKHLTRHKILALHGMSGSGKTCVAISVLRHNPELITNNFNGVIFWRNLGNCKTEDDIIAQQNKLYRRASSMCTHNSFMNSSVSMSSMGSNADSLSSYDWSWQELRDRLKSVFSEQTLKESLLVLDEVNEKKCLEAFDIGCKILVTTRDTDVVANFHPQIIKAESLSLFASCIDISESKLPRQAKKLHEICKGSPFHIALIGAELCENKERLVHDTRHWNYYLGKLERKDFFFLTRQNGNPMKTIEMCINSLKSDILPLFRMLTILPDGAKVSAKVLSKLWNKDVGRVESIMKHLRSKSLIIEFYDQEQRNYIYEIHDLIMNYLRSSSNEEDIKKIHGDFLKSYNYDMNTAPVEIEDDGYIAFYIGYHLLNTQNLNNRWGLFNKLFLNLKFLGNKVRLTGPADVILDLQKYENYIVEEFFHITTNKLKKELKCSDSSVKWVGASPVNPSRVASLSYDGVIKLCYIDDLEQEENEEIIEEDTSKIITLKEKEITEFDCKLSGYLRQICTNCKHRMILSSANIKDSVCFLSVAVNKKGTLLFVSTDDSRIICVDIKTTSYLFDLENKRGNVVTMAVSEILTWDDFEPGPDVLLSGTGNIENSVKVWFLDASYVSQNTLKNGKARLTTKFDASFIHTATPNTPISNNTSHSTNNTPKRHQSFVNSKDVVKKVVKSTMSLDRHSLKPLNLKGICNGLMDNVAQPLLAVVDDKNNIQRMLDFVQQISTDVDEQITAIKISPCNQHIVFGLYSGVVRKYSMCTKETLDIMDVYSPVQYLNFVNTNLLIVAGKNRCLMAYKMGDEGWKSVKKKHQSDQLSNSSSELSVTSRLFSNGDTRERLCRPSNLVACYWVQEIGLVAIETNATIKLWDCELKLSSVLNGRQTDVYIKCSAFQKNILVICDDHNMAFQTLELKKRGGVSLSTIQESKLNNRIISCALTSDGNILAMGLDSGDVAWCGFSPSPEKLFRSSASPSHASPTLDDDEQAPLVLVTMAAEIVWWNITYIIRMRPNRSYWRTGWNVVTPIASPLEPRSEISGDLNVDSTNFFFSSSLLTPHYQWKKGSKRKEILACIKLSGMYAKKICHDDQFSCFVTVDHPGHAHIMSLMKTNC
ncbi:unnamed protein product [Leptidea sinapis]|uniref:CARD domain-containing protein n=1 Tax=Leptidea sinapis TaxID=189913 RepID=A0A5E4PP39_9NEOP|nr:unnamed protein product [Leptidea sinapis]